MKLNGTEQGKWTFLNEVELLDRVNMALAVLLGADRIHREPILGRARPDFLVERSGSADVIVEVKGVTPRTRSRLSQVVAQFNVFVQEYRQHFLDRPTPQLALVVSDELSEQNLEYLKQGGIAFVWSRSEVEAAIRADSGEGAVSEEGSSPGPDERQLIEKLIGRIEQLSPGKRDAVAYQAACRDLLTELLVPPLKAPLHESSNEPGVNRRDMIFPNYAETGLWYYVRQTYAAHFIVADAKNYSGKVKKKDILQLSNYLSIHSTGLFGIIVTRDSADNGASVTRREHWFMHGKLIIVLNDADLRQMVTTRLEGGDPAEHIRQKIEDFRIAF